MRGVAEREVGEGAVGFEEVDGEAGGEGLADGDAEEGGPAEAFAVDPFVFVLFWWRRERGLVLCALGRRDLWSCGVVEVWVEVNVPVR